MANYLKGIGDAATRVNEILPSLDARINNFLCGHTSGIIRGEFYGFSASAIDRGVVVKGGMMQAYGYFGCSDTDTQINFVMPSATRYVHLYSEIDLSVVPNRFEVKATAMSNSSAWTPRADNLKTTTNGKYQFPLWQVTLTASTIILTDRRVYIDKPLISQNAEYGVTQAFSDNSTKIATTAFVKQAIKDHIYCHHIYLNSATMYNSNGGGEARSVMVWFTVINSRAAAYTPSDIGTAFPNQNLGPTGTIPMRSVMATGRVQNDSRPVIAVMRSTSGNNNQLQVVLHSYTQTVDYYTVEYFPVQTVIDTVVKLT